MQRIRSVARSAAELLRRAVLARATIDARALAGLRIGLGLVVLLDLALRARDLVAFYTDDGVVTRSVLAGTHPAYGDVSIHALSGTAWFQGVLFLLAGIFAVALIAGYRTRLATIASFVLLASLHLRNPTVLNSGDVLLRRLLFWGILLPLGAAWSVDATHGSEDGRGEGRSGRGTESGGGDVTSGSRDPGTVANLATLALLCQVVVVYAVNAAFKLREGPWLRGEALQHVLALDQFVVFLGPVLARSPEVATLLAWLWLGMVVLSWVLLASTGWIRGVLASLFVAMHVGMALTLDLGVFPLVSIVALLPFLPPPVWERVERWGDGHAARLRALGDRLAPDARTSGVVSRATRARLHTVVVGCLFAVLLVTNAFAVGLVQPPEGTPDRAAESSWTMFARPPMADDWIVPRGRLASGGDVDALRDAPVRLDRPPDEGRYPNARWRKHLSRYREYPELRPALAGYLCRRWNANEDGDRTLRELWIVRVRSPNDGTASSPERSEVLGHYRCVRGGTTAVAGPE